MNPNLCRHYDKLEVAARALVDTPPTAPSVDHMTAARYQLEIALLQIEQQHMLLDIDGYQRMNRAYELENARLEQLNAVQVTHIVALMGERDIAHAHTRACTQEVEQLRARIAELEAQLVAPAAPPAPVETVKPFVCDVCGAAFAKAKGLTMHQRRAHGQRQTASAAPVVEAAPVAPLVERSTLAADDPHWRCATCGRAEGAPFARSLSDHDRCVQCVQSQVGGAQTNGLVAASY